MSAQIIIVVPDEVVRLVQLNTRPLAPYDIDLVKSPTMLAVDLGDQIDAASDKKLARLAAVIKTALRAWKPGELAFERYGFHQVVGNQPKVFSALFRTDAATRAWIDGLTSEIRNVGFGRRGATGPPAPYIVVGQTWGARLPEGGDANIRFRPLPAVRATRLAIVGPGHERLALALRS